MPSNNLQMIRGDTFEIIYTPELTRGEPYMLVGNDTIKFHITLPNKLWEDYIIEKTFTYVNQDNEGRIKILLEPEDTEDLTNIRYYYSIKLFRNHTESGTTVKTTTTLTNKSKFIILD